MTTVIHFDKVKTISAAEEGQRFSISKSRAAFLSYDNLVVADADHAVISLFLENVEGAPEDSSEFLVYPAGQFTDEQDAKAYKIPVDFEIGQFLDIRLPEGFFDGVSIPLGLVIRPIEQGDFIFSGADNTTHSPRLTVEGGDVTAASVEKIALPDDDRIILRRILINQARLLQNTAKTWYGSPFVTIPLGIFLGVASSILYGWLKIKFPLLP